MNGRICRTVWEEEEVGFQGFLKCIYFTGVLGVLGVFWGFLTGCCLFGVFWLLLFWGYFYCSFGTLLRETEMQELERGQENHQDQHPGAEVTFGSHHHVGLFLPLKPF